MARSKAETETRAETETGAEEYRSPNSSQEQWYMYLGDVAASHTIGGSEVMLSQGKTFMARSDDETIKRLSLQGLIADYKITPEKHG